MLVILSRLETRGDSFFLLDGALLRFPSRFAANEAARLDADLLRYTGSSFSFGGFFVASSSSKETSCLSFLLFLRLVFPIKTLNFDIASFSPLFANAYSQ